MKNKGFTLIELLAVIVILAIIALIATPIILGIIEDARTSAAERSAELVKSGVQNAYTGYMMKNNGDLPSSIEAFMTNELFTVDSAELQTDSTANSAVVETEDDVTCTITPDTTNGKILLSCEGSFATPGEGSPSGWTAGIRTYDFTGKLAE